LVIDGLVEVGAAVVAAKGIPFNGPLVEETGGGGLFHVVVLVL
jgi:hypothetical protein